MSTLLYWLDFHNVQGCQVSTAVKNPHLLLVGTNLVQLLCWATRLIRSNEMAKSTAFSLKKAAYMYLPNFWPANKDVFLASLSLPKNNGGYKLKLEMSVFAGDQIL